MKFAIAIVSSLFIVPIASAQSLCERFATERPAPTLVRDYTDVMVELTDVDLSAVHTAVLLNKSDDKLVDIGEALHQFRKHEGSVKYYELADGQDKVTIMTATFAPGDNVYGPIFVLAKKGPVTPRLIGEIGDSEVSCLGERVGEL